MFGQKSSWPAIEHEQIVQRARILVIDDGEFPYLKLFKRDGYNIEKWNDVKDLTRLEAGNFDVILLDLLGVGRSESADEGFGVLKHIRTAKPAQIVVAYSNAEWPVKYQPFFEMADAVLPKTGDYVEFKRTVDDLLQQRFALGFYLSRVNDELGEQAASVPKATAKAQKALVTRKIGPLHKYLERHLDDQVTIDRVLAIVQIGISAAQLWKS